MGDEGHPRCPALAERPLEALLGPFTLMSGDQEEPERSRRRAPEAP